MPVQMSVRGGLPPSICSHVQTWFISIESQPEKVVLLLMWWLWLLWLYAGRRAGDAATSTEVPCVPPGAASVGHQYPVTGLTSANMQQLRQYDRPPIIGNGEQSSQCVFSDNFPVLSSYQPDVVKTVCGPGPGVFSSEGVGTVTGSDAIVTTHSQLFQICNHGVQQCSPSCGGHLGNLATGSGAVVRGSQTFKCKLNYFSAV